MKKKLRLSAETLMNLDTSALTRVHGGVLNNSFDEFCATDRCLPPSWTCASNAPTRCGTGQD